MKSYRKFIKGESVPPCFTCGNAAKKKDGKNYWLNTCGNKECLVKLRNERMQKTKSSEEGHKVAVLAGKKSAETKRTTIIDGKTQAELTAQKIKAANLKIDESGLTGYERGSRKAVPKIKLAKSIVGTDGLTIAQRTAKKAAPKIRQTKSVVGEDGLTAYQRNSRKSAPKTRATRLQVGEDGLTSYKRAARKCADKGRKTQEANGRWIPLSEKDDLEIYRVMVRREERKFLSEIQRLEDYEKRGLSGTPGAYQIDHKVSILFGFLNNIEPRKIGHICNLEMKPWLDNTRKLARCDITVQELDEAITKHERKKA